MTTQEASHKQISVINRNFCHGRSIDLTITKNIWQIGQGIFVVKNSIGKIIFKIEGSMFSFNRTRVMSDAASVPIITLRKKAFSISTTWQAFRGDGKDQKDLIFSVRRSSIFQMKTKLAVFVAKNKNEDVCDYTVKASWFQRFCEVYVGDSSTKLAHMHKNSSLYSLFTGKEFKVTVYPNVDSAFVVALIVVLDDIVSQAKRSSKRHKQH